MLFICAFVALFLFLWLLFVAVGPALERLLAHTAKRTAALRVHDYLPVVLLLGGGIAMAFVTGDAFFDIAERVEESSPQLITLDGGVQGWARETRTPGATAFFTAMTLIGTPVGLGLLVAAVCIGLAMRGRQRWAAYLAVTSIGGALLNQALKSWFARARPELAEALRGAHGYSFPSGHAMGSTIIFGALSYVTFRLLHRWPARAAALAFACSMVTAISVSRIYLGVHWISDVAAGVAAGLIWLTATTVAYETFRRIRLVRSIRARRNGA